MISYDCSLEDQFRYFTRIAVGLISSFGQHLTETDGQIPNRLISNSLNIEKGVGLEIQRNELIVICSSFVQTARFQKDRHFEEHPLNCGYPGRGEGSHRFVQSFASFELRYTDFDVDLIGADIRSVAIIAILINVIIESETDETYLPIDCEMTDPFTHPISLDGSHGYSRPTDHQLFGRRRIGTTFGRKRLVISVWRHQYSNWRHFAKNVWFLDKSIRNWKPKKIFNIYIQKIDSKHKIKFYLSNTCVGNGFQK